MPYGFKEDITEDMNGVKDRLKGIGDEPKPLLCPLCYAELADYCADLKCPSCKCDLDGEALKEMLGFKAYLDKNGLTCVGGKVVQAEPVVQKIDIKEVIANAARRKWMDLQSTDRHDLEFAQKMATMNVQEMSQEMITPSCSKRGFFARKRRNK